MSEKRIPAETPEAFDDPRGSVYPIQFVQVGKLTDIPAPLVRITTCGGFQFSVLHEVINTNPPQGCYRAISLENRPKGSSTAVTLLKILTSQPGYAAARDWLSEHLSGTKSTGEEEEEDGFWERGMVRVDNVAGLLRGLLCPLWITEPNKKTLRKILVKTLKNHRESGLGYQLATEPLVWLDVDDIAASIRLACLREERGKDALPFWEQAYTLAAQGAFLPQEPYSDWANDKRIEIDGYLRQAVHALRGLLITRYGQASESRVIFLLRKYWQMHPMDEEALRHLMELLSKHGSIQEAQEYYQRLCELLKLEGDRPEPLTQKTAQNLVRFGQNTYGHVVPSLNPEAVSSTYSQDTIMSHSTPQPEEVLSLLSAAIAQGIMIAVQALERIDMDTTRRDFLHLLGNSLVLAGGVSKFQPFVNSILNGDQMGLLETEVATRWHVYHSGNTLQALNGLDLWVAEAERFAKEASSRSQNTHASTLVSISYQLQGSIFRDMMSYDQAHHAYQKAFLFADEWDNVELKSASLARRGVTFIQQQKPMDAIEHLEGALLIIDDLHLPFLKGYIFQALSEAHAMAHHHDQSQRNIDLAEQVLAQKKTVRESSNCQLSTTSVTAQRGVNAVLLQDYARALDLLHRGLNTYAPSLLRGRARLIAQQAEAYYGLGRIDECTSTAQDAFTIAHAIGSQKTIARVKNLSLLLKQSTYGKESSVLQLGRILAINKCGNDSYF